MTIDHSILDRVGFQRFQIHELQNRDMACLQHHRTGVACFERLCPAPHTNTTAVAGRQTGEIIFRTRRDEVVALQLQKVEKWLRNLAADCMQPVILRSRAAKTIAIKAVHWRKAAALQWLAKNVAGHG